MTVQVTTQRERCKHRIGLFTLPDRQFSIKIKVISVIYVMVSPRNILFWECSRYKNPVFISGITWGWEIRAK